MVPHVLTRAFQPLFAVLLTACGLCFSPQARALETTWDPSFNVPGADHFVYSMAETATDIYYGGAFRAVGNTQASNIIRFQKSDSTWHTLAQGTNNTVKKIVVSGSDLYVGGDFTIAGTTTVNYIAKWNSITSTWSALGTGVGGGFAPAIRDMAEFNGQLYVTGSFTTAGGIASSAVARWNGASWSAVGTGLGNVGFSPTGNALAVMGGNLYITGEFDTAGGVTCNNIAKWTGSTWEALHPDGLSGGGGRAHCLAVIGSDLYVGGYFSRAGTVLFGSDNLMKWNGTTFSGVGGGANDTVLALATDGSSLYAGGEFTTAGGGAANHVAKWSGSAWSATGAGTNGDVYSLAIVSGMLHAGGRFATAGTVAATNVARWTGSAWEAVASGKGVGDVGFNGKVNVLVDTGTHLYVGGRFITAGPVIANGIAVFDKATETWSALGTGLGTTGFLAGSTPSVSAILIDGTDVYVGGAFNLAGGSPANNIAKWNGTSWSALGTGCTSSVWALTKMGSDIYAAGVFNTAGGITVNCVAKWNGTAWSALGNGVSSSGYATSLAVMGTDLYVGGSFPMASGTTVNNVAKWNGSAWSALASGLDDDVEALLIDGSNLYVAGSFTNAGGVAVNRIAKWNGTAWSALGSGIGYTPYTMTMNGTNLFVGGSFSSAGGSPAQYLAVWNGSTWEAVAENMRGLGEGSPAVDSIVINGTTAYFGTNLISAGNVPFGRFGKATLSPSSNKPLVAILGATSPTTKGISISVTVNPKGLTTTATLHYGTTQALGLTKTIPLSPANGTTGKTVLVPLTGLTQGTQYYYRAIASNSAGTSETPLSSFTTVAPPVITVPPANQLAVLGSNVTLSATVTGSSFLTYQWLKKTTPVVGAQTPNYLINGITFAHAGEYALKATNDYGTATSTPLAKLCVVDTTDKVIGGKALATLVIPAPAAGPGLTFQWYKGGQILMKGALGGRATGVDTAKLSIAKFTVADEDDYTCVVKLGAIERTTGNIAAKIQTPPQIDAVAAFALPWIVGGSVDEPITALITFLDALPQNLPTKYVIANLPTGLSYDGTTGRIFGKPTKSGPFKVKVTASNSAGTAPAEEITVNVAALDTPLVGVFNGLVTRSSLMNSNYGGSFTATTTLGGSISGKVIMAGKSNSFGPAALNTAVGSNATLSIPVKVGTETLSLNMTINRTSGQLTGTLSGNGNADVSAWRNPWSGKTPAETATALAAHPFTAAVRMTSANSSTSYPQGEGYGILTITKTGIATWKGQLADATTMTCSTTVGPNGEVPLHVMLYSNTGSFLGWVQAVADNSNAPASYANNTLDNGQSPSPSWYKNTQPPNSTTRSYKSGIPLHNMTVIGGAWPKLTAPNLVLGLSDASATNNARLIFSSAGVETSTLPNGTALSGSPLVQVLRIKAPANAVGMPPAAQNPGIVTLSLNAGTGEIKGTFSLKDTNPVLTSQKVTRTPNFFGVLVKRLGKGFGHFNLAKLPQAAQGQTPATTPTTSPMLSGRVVFEAISQ